MATSRRPQERGKLARRGILAAAETLFAEQGFLGTSLDAVARRVGMSKQRILHYYPSKRALYEAVVEDVMSFLDEMQGMYEATAASDGQDLAPLEIWVDRLAARPTIASLFMYEAASPRSADHPRAFAPFVQQITAEFEKIFHKLVPNAQPDDAFHFSSTITGTTLFYATALHESASGRNQRGVKRSADRHKQLVLSTARNLLAEIRATAARRATRPVSL